MLKIAHYSDLHSREATKTESLKVLEFILQESASRGVDLIVNSGDTFDGPILLGDSGPVADLLDLLTAYKIPHFIIEGTKSHDVPGSVDIFGRIRSSFIQVFRKPQSFPLYLPRFGQAACGHISVLPAPSKSFFNINHAEQSQEEAALAISDGLKSILANFAVAAEDRRPHILISHITVTGSETSTGQVLIGGDIQLSVSDLRLANADYVALGHIHKAQQPQLMQEIRYAGSPYHQSFGELEDKGFNIVTFGDRGELQNIEFIKTPSRPRQVIDAEIIDGSLVFSEEPFTGADIEVRIYGQKHLLHDSLIEDAKGRCSNAGSLSVKTIPVPDIRQRSVELSHAKNLTDEFSEYCQVKDIEVPQGAVSKINEMEEAGL